MTPEEIFKQLFGKELEKINLDELPCETRVMIRVLSSVFQMMECHAVAIFDVLQKHGGLPLSEELKNLLDDYHKSFEIASQIKLKKTIDEWYKSHHSGN